jgi:hypothetical protein
LTMVLSLGKLKVHFYGSQVVVRNVKQICLLIHKKRLCIIKNIGIINFCLNYSLHF